MSVAFSDCLPALFKWGRFYASNRHDVFELVSAVWLKGNVQKLDDIKRVSLKVKREMMDYLRKEDGPRRKCNSTFVEHFVSYEEGLVHSNDAQYEHVDVVDLVCHLMKESDLSLREQDVLELVFWKSMTVPEVAVFSGHSVEWCCLILNSALAKVKQAFVKSDLYESDVCYG